MNKIKKQKIIKASTVKKHWVRLTRVCNNKCVFCLDKEPQNGSILSLVQIKKELALGLKNGCQQVVLSGGEATIHPQFIKIVALAKRLGYKKIQVITNGRMFSYEKFLNSAVEAGLDEATFSIHGHNAALHDKQTGITGSFKQALAGLINALRMPKLIVSQDIVINRYNYKSLYEIMSFFISLGVTEFDLLQIIPFGRAWDNRRKIFYNLDEAKPYLEKAFALARNKNLFIWTNRFPAKYLEGFEDLIQNPKKIKDEVSGRKELYEKYLSTGIMLDCYPGRCKYCFLQNFCIDLMSFRTSGQIESKAFPACLTAKKERPKRILKYGEGVDINDFADFYLENCYTVKSLRCLACRNDRDCQGVHIEMIRKSGFGIIKVKK